MDDIGSYVGAELVLALVAPVGTDLEQFVETLTECLQAYSYRTGAPVRLSELTDAFDNQDSATPRRVGSPEYVRIMRRMDAGNNARQRGGRDVMALAAAAAIQAERRLNKREQKEPLAKRTHVIWSLKHPAEVLTLRRIYGPGFFLIGVVTKLAERRTYLETRKGCDPDEIVELIKRDEHEGEAGQRTRDTFELADVFVRLDDLDGVKRFLRLIFGAPYETPSLDEYAMFLAFTAALRSGDLSRQVGAVVVSAGGDVVAVGTNDVPRAGGGLYWADDDDDDRDLRRGYDTNQLEKTKIVDEILKTVAPAHPKTSDAMKRWIDRGRKKLKSAAVMDITEYGRAVHAEMEALLSCTGSGTSTRGGTLFSTTFPCHNCAKHIIAAGISRVVYVEPYPKSRARNFYPRSIDDSTGSATYARSIAGGIGPVSFEPFRGIGPRRFFDLFSIGPSSGYPVKRKDQQSRTRRWTPGTAEVRVPLLPTSYVMREQAASIALKAVTFARPKKKGP